jgi:SNF2 family DNA or RNA helicase
MSSHPIMLLDPKGAKRQAQSNGNHPDSSSPPHDLSPMDFPNVPSEASKDPFDPLTYSSHLRSTALSSSDITPDPSSPVHFSLLAMDTTMGTGIHTSLELEKGLIEAEASVPDVPQMGSTDFLVSDGDNALYTLMETEVLPANDPVSNDPPMKPDSQDDDDIKSANDLVSSDSPVKPDFHDGDIATSANGPVSVDPSVNLDLQNGTRFMSENHVASPEAPANSVPQNGDIAMSDELPGPDATYVDSATQIDTSSMAANTIDHDSNLPSCDSFLPIVSLALDPMPTGEPESLGLLLEYTGKQNGTRSIHGSPMAPAGTATVARLRDPPSRAPSAVNSEASTPAPQAAPSMAFQFTTPNDDESESDAKRSHHEISDDENKFDRRNLLSNVYGVEDRKRQLKKIKTASEQASGANTPISISGDSSIGKYMKEGEEKQASASTVADVVDLTAGKIVHFPHSPLRHLTGPNVMSDVASTSQDDDEIQCTGSTDLSTQRVCYGKIDGAMIISHLVPKPADSSFFVDQNNWPSLRVELRRPPNPIRGDLQIDVIDPHGCTFGKIDPKTAQGLCALLDDKTSTVDVAARLNTRRRSPDEAVYSSTSGIWHASINIYGQRQRAEAIGKFLAHRNVWLGTPNSVEQGTALFNPHSELRRAQALAAAANISRERMGPVIRYESRTAEEVNDAVTKMFDQLIKADIPTMEPSSRVKTPLLHHQKQALWFMTEKEKPRKFGPREADNNSLWREVIRSDGRKQYKEIISGIVMDHKPKEALGGLLADMMGLGKTLSILSLVDSSLDQAEEWTDIAPHPKLVRDCPGIRNVKATLLVAPLSAVANWTSQIAEHMKKGLSYYVFHGPSRTNDLDELSDHDIIITTYSTIHSEISGRGAKAGRVSPLSKMNFFRIVLDEAHTIRERNAAQTKAIMSLHANRRWSVTGTPIQNRMDDLFSVTNFLQIFPYSERAAFSQHIAGPVKSGNPSLTNLRVIVDSFTLRRVKDRISLPPREENIITLEFSEKEKQLHEFFRNESQVMLRFLAGDSKNKLGGRTYHHVLKAMLILRQVSAHGKELLDTSDRERAKGFSAQDAIDLEDGDSEENSTAIDKRAFDMFQLMQDGSQVPRCSQCSARLAEKVDASGNIMQNAPMAFFLPCWDIFCPDCFSGWKPAFDSSTNTEIRCPSCDGWISMNYSSITPASLQNHMDTQAREHKLGKSFGDYEGPHTKTIALVNYLLQSVEDSKLLPAGQPPIKSVVFSSWTSHLDLLEIALTHNGLGGFTRLDGSMSLPVRTRALEKFAKDDSCTILLVTIGAGGVGLNLTSASRVFIMEPQYNPASVAQAVDRVHRLGQTRPVQIFKLIMKDSIEEKIMDLADKKQREADMTMNRQKLGKRETQEARMREMQGLFK